MKVGLTGILCSGIPHDFALELQKKKKTKKNQTLENPQMVLYGYAGRLIGGSFSSKRVSFNRFKIYARMYIFTHIGIYIYTPICVLICIYSTKMM
jgi:hypothetical protein